jgi:two-component system chemotaxis sensor kinase CheA
MDDGIVKEFLVESYENLDRLDRDLVDLERDPSSRETLGSVFRTIHTIKGTCGFLGFSRLEKVAHAGESLLSRLRDGQLKLTPDVATVLLAMVDAVRQMLTGIERSRSDDGRDYSALIEALHQAETGEAPEPAAGVKRYEVGAAAPRSQGMFEDLIRSGRLDREQVELAARLQQAGDPRRIGEILVDMGVLHPDDVLQALRTQSQQSAASAVQSSIRVDVDLLEKLMNHVGELVLARNQILQLIASQDHAAMPAASQRLSAITSELQEAVMKTRMQPIRTLWNRLPRVVRDAAASCGKEVRLEMDGADTELDRGVIEAIKDPLTHLVRNAVDHGVEDAATRAAQGKPAAGRLTLRAFHEGGQVNLEVADDGGGIALERIRARALERRLVTAEQASQMQERDWMNFIFLPGFSTAETVTNISGRGVGMDVVKSNLERIGGSIEVESRPGHGTTMKIKIPLTLAIIPALCVRAGGEEYAIPQANLVELVRLQGEAARRGVERVHDAAVFRLRGRLLPLVFLSDWLGVGRADATSDVLQFAVLQTDGRRFGLVVDQVGDSREIIVKPLGRPLSQIPTYAGATILGDGRVALILDVHGIARQAGIVVEAGHTIVGGGAEPDEAEAPAAALTALLVFDLREGWRAAAPLRSITRLEEFDPRDIERAADRQVVQYHDTILPLVRLEHLLDPGAPRHPGHGPATVLVCDRGGRSVGLVVHAIVDIEEYAALPGPADRSGIAGSLVIGGRVTDVLDLEPLLERAGAGRFEVAEPFAAAGGANP